MTSHELARLLLSKPDVPVATHASNHTHIPPTEEYMRRLGFDTIRVGMLNTGHVCIGNISKRNINGSPKHGGQFIVEMWYGDAPEEWGR